MPAWLKLHTKDLLLLFKPRFFSGTLPTSIFSSPYPAERKTAVACHPGNPTQSPGQHLSQTLLLLCLSFFHPPPPTHTKERSELIGLLSSHTGTNLHIRDGVQDKSDGSAELTLAHVAAQMPEGKGQARLTSWDQSKKDSKAKPRPLLPVCKSLVCLHEEVCAVQGGTLLSFRVSEHNRDDLNVIFAFQAQECQAWTQWQPELFRTGNPIVHQWFITIFLKTITFKIQKKIISFKPCKNHSQI